MAAPPTCAAPSTSGISRRGEEGLVGAEQPSYCRKWEGSWVGFHPAFACALLPATQLTLLTPLLQSIYHPVCSMDWSGTSTATNKAMDSRHRCGQCWGAALHSTASAALQFTLHAATQCNSTAGRLGGMVSS